MSENAKITEQSGRHEDLTSMDFTELAAAINSEDQTVARAVERALDSIAALTECAAKTLISGGRMFYIGAGTSGRLGILDASECPPTYGVPHDMVIGLIAGGDCAIRRAVEGAEDDRQAAIRDLREAGAREGDLVIGITASGTTPYVIGGLIEARKAGMKTGSIACNPDAAVSREADFPVEVVTGPEIVTGSTRMKAGTAQKLVLNMISTGAMIALGRVEGNKMVDMQLSNNKLIDRGTRMVMDALKVEEAQARELLLKNGSVRRAIEEGRDHA